MHSVNDCSFVWLCILAFQPVNGERNLFPVKVGCNM